MATPDSTISVQRDRFDAATLRISGANALILALGILIGESTDDDGEMPISKSLLNEAMHGISALLGDASNDLSAEA